MSNDVALPSQFKDALRERILAAFVDLIPQDQLSALIDAEVKEFFETPRLLTVEETTVTVDNPRYLKDGNTWGSSPTVKKAALAFGSHMTPFRQLVWSTLYESLAPKIEVIIEDENSKCKKELDAWLIEQATPQIGATNKTMFSQLSMSMSSMLLHNTMQTALSVSHSSLKTSLSLGGVDISQMPDVQAPTHPFV